MWEINNASQLIAFLTSLAVGCVFCLIYDIFRAVRKSFKRNAAAMFFEDVLYSFICGVIGFCFLLGTTGGDLRAFAFLGMGAGFFICRGGRGNTRLRACRHGRRLFYMPLYLITSFFADIAFYNTRFQNDIR